MRVDHMFRQFSCNTLKCKTKPGGILSVCNHLWLVDSKSHINRYGVGIMRIMRMVVDMRIEIGGSGSKIKNVYTLEIELLK